MPTQLLTIPKPKSKSYIYWEHAIKSVFAFVGTYALTIFGPLLAGGKSRHNRDGSTDLLVYFLEHPLLTFGLCVFVTVAYNIYIFSSNKKSNYIVGIQQLENSVAFSLTSIYYKKTQSVSVPLENLEVKVVTKTSDISGKTITIQFIEKETQNWIGIIKPGHTIWSKQKKAIMEALYQLHTLGVKSSSVKKGGKSSVEALFK